MIPALLIFLILALAAAAFVALPLARRRGSTYPQRRLAAAIVGVVLVVGLGGYALLGRPQLAARSFESLSPNDFPGLIATLSERLRSRPDDVQGWTLLGRGYLTLGEDADAAQALGQAVDAAQRQNKLTATLLADYGEALVRARGPTSAAAEDTLRRALKLDPKDPKARYYLGLARAMEGQEQAALALWQGLLAEAPPDAPWREALVDQIAALNAASLGKGGVAPDVNAMVAGLAQRLADNPHDLEGWQRLLRAYAVLGDADKLKDALAKAQSVFAGDEAALQTLTAAARSRPAQTPH